MVIEAEITPSFNWGSTSHDSKAEGKKPQFLTAFLKALWVGANCMLGRRLFHKSVATEKTHLLALSEKF